MINKLSPRQKALAIRKAHPEFKSERTLGISSREYCALYAVRGGLLMGQFVHVRNIHMDPKVPNGFNMAMDCNIAESKDKDNPHCSTVACIGGWMALALNPQATLHDREYFVSKNDRGGEPFSELFYPSEDARHGPDWEKYTPKQAAKAIDAFMGGNVDNPWDGI